jgi:hypothetical protein
VTLLGARKHKSLLPRIKDYTSRLKGVPMQDNDLLSILDEGGLWDICLADEIRHNVPSLRNALYEARRAAPRGTLAIRIIKMPDDEIVVRPEQIMRLWSELDLA